MIGTGFLSELEGVFADSFGVCVTGFQEKLRKAKNIALKELKDRAVRIGADAIVGVDIDYMTLQLNVLMITANGTAVKLGLPKTT